MTPMEFNLSLGFHAPSWLVMSVLAMLVGALRTPLLGHKSSGSKTAPSAADDLHRTPTQEHIRKISAQKFVRNSRIADSQEIAKTFLNHIRKGLHSP